MTDDDLPPSALFVKFYLENLPELHDDPPEEVPRKQIQVETDMDPRTVRRACDRLEKAGVIKQVPNWSDLKTPSYRLLGQNVQLGEA